MVSPIVLQNMAAKRTTRAESLPLRPFLLPSPLLHSQAPWGLLTMLTRASTEIDKSVQSSIDIPES